MKKLLSAKQLTFRYFSFVAIAIIAIHATVFEMTTEDLEHIYAQNRLDRTLDYLQSSRPLDNTDNTTINLITQGKADFDKATQVIFNFDQVPTYFPDVESLPYNQGIEVENNAQTSNFFIMKVLVTRGEKSADALLVMDNNLYELSEEQLFSAQVRPIIISAILTVLSLLVVLKISDRLAQPVSKLARTLAQKRPDNLRPVRWDEGIHTREIEELVTTFNDYEARIESLLQKERAFNRYASHELRSPLMVMRGALDLLSQSQEASFVEKQTERLRKATDDMSDFIETLLSLTKPLDSLKEHQIRIDKLLLNKIAQEHSHLLESKKVTWNISIEGSPTIKMPVSAFHILLGNLVKNAFAYTSEGQVTIFANSQYVSVTDTGKGYRKNSSESDGFGLGLLLVRDICNRFGYHFEIESNKGGGSTATIFLVNDNEVT